MKRGLITATMFIALFAFIAVAKQENQKQSFEPAAYYKKNCAECHGNEAEKKFTPDLPESQLIDAILNGEKMETPPDMPAFAEKGITEERAKALIAYMKSLRE